MENVLLWNLIRTFKTKATQAIFEGFSVRQFRNVEESARRRLVVLNLARSLADLKSPSNHLEALTEDRKGQFSIRVNRQYRICFRWEENDAFDVELVDYH